MQPQLFDAVFLNVFFLMLAIVNSVHFCDESEMETKSKEKRRGQRKERKPVSTLFKMDSKINKQTKQREEVCANTPPHHTKTKHNQSC
jgi:hypothetical protein